MRGKSKKSVVAGVLALSMILMGTGYAYWTDDLNVTTKATTGDMDVTFADLGLYAQYTNEASGWSIVDGIGVNGYVDSTYFLRGSSDYNKIAADGSINAYYNHAKGYNNVEFGAELVAAKLIDKTIGTGGSYTPTNAMGSDKIELSVKNMYPGYAQTFRTDILNVGEIAAKLSNINFGVKGVDGATVNDSMKGMLGVAIYIDKEAYQFNTEEDGDQVFKLCDSLGVDPDNNIFQVGGVDFLRLSALEALTTEAINQAVTAYNLMCSPNSDNRMDLYVAVAMDPDANGAYTSGQTTNADFLDKQVNDANSQNMGVNITMDFLWDQFNVGKDAGTANILVNQNYTPAQ